MEGRVDVQDVPSRVSDSLSLFGNALRYLDSLLRLQTLALTQVDKVDLETHVSIGKDQPSSINPGTALARAMVERDHLGRDRDKTSCWIPYHALRPALHASKPSIDMKRRPTRIARGNFKRRSNSFHRRTVQ